MTKLKEMQMIDKAALGFAPSFSVSAIGCVADISRFDTSRYCLFPGFCDVPGHFREPGFSYK